MEDKEFGQLVSEAIDSIPEEFAKKMANVAVTIEDEPTQAQLRQLRLPPWALLFGLYQGVSQPRRGIYYSAIPDKITIYKNSILRVSRTHEEVRAQVRITVIHEIGHHFGLSDAELRKSGK